MLPLGSGAYGEVHLAWDREDRRWVALKRFTGQDELGLLRMVIESRIRVSHPHLVRTLAFRLVDDRAWLVTELARGGSLRGLIVRTGRLPWGWVAEIVDQILSALTALHATGVIHRDLKPANLLLRSHGATNPHLLVGDFGIATWRTVSMTGVGAAIGTPGYLAPEYLDGRPPSPATDLFAVGVLAAELLTGRRLVHLSNASPTIPSSWHDVLPVPAEVPAALARVLQHMADPDPGHRYRDCAQARDALLTAAPPAHRGDLTTVTVPDLLASLPDAWTPDGPTTVLATPTATTPAATHSPTPTPTAATSAVPHPPTTTPPTTTTPTATQADPSPADPSPAGFSHEPAGPSPDLRFPERFSPDLAPTPPSAEPLPHHGTPPVADGSEPNLAALPIDGGPTGLILEHEATIQSAGATTAVAPPLPNPTSGSSTGPVSGSSTQPPSGSATFVGTPPRGVDAKAVRKARRGRKAKQAVLFVVLIILATGAGTLWWAANHRAVPGQASAAGASTSRGETPAGRWEPVVVGPCAAVDVGHERDGANGRERCQRADARDQRQNWVEEPPGGFPTSDPVGPFPDQNCANDGDKKYSPVGDHLQCTDGTWHVIT